jgi:hypothetical protein
VDANTDLIATICGIAAAALAAALIKRNIKGMAGTIVAAVVSPAVAAGTRMAMRELLGSGEARA